MSETTEALLSIGDVAEATDISVDTIRVWERRYGRPQPVRLPSGHRRYTEEHVRWLRRVAEALANGYRPSRVVQLSELELDQLLEPKPAAAPEADFIQALLELVVVYDGDGLRARLDDEFTALGPREFLRRRAAPLVTAVGRAWADGDLSIRHEHFLTEILEDKLRTLRLSLEEGGGPLLVLATLSGETHGLGIQMAALIGTVCGMRPRMLGTEVPNEEIVSAAAELEADVACVSVSLSTGGVRTDRVLGELRAMLPGNVRLVIGGRGARGVRRGPRGVEYVEDLADFDRWLGDLAVPEGE